MRSFDQLLLQTLGHTADDAHDQSGVGPAVAFHLGQTAPDALFGIVADRTGVDQDNVRLVDPLGIYVPFALHHGDHDLGVADIHLAAVGFDKSLRPAPDRGRNVFVSSLNSTFSFLLFGMNLVLVGELLETLAESLVGVGHHHERRRVDLLDLVLHEPHLLAADHQKIMSRSASVYMPFDLI